MLYATRTRQRWRALLPVVMLVVSVVGVPVTSVVGVPVPPAIAAPGDVGFQGPPHDGASTPTVSKPESKLWWNDGTWWGSLFDTVAKKHQIHRLDAATQTWQKTGVFIDERGTSRADALWDGTKLYIASHVYSTTPAAGYPARLYRYSYNATTKTYSLDSGFPSIISDYRSETLVLAKDGTGKLWATWTEGNKVWINRTVGNDLTWGTPFVPAVTGAADLKADDISSIISFAPGRVGVMWSNQNTPSMFFAVHVDGAADTAWSVETAYGGTKNADDHINLKTDATGRVFAVTKTSQTSGSATAIAVLVRATSGTWTQHQAWRVTDGTTRPIMLLDTEHQEIRLFATAPEGDGIIYTKRSPLNAISFPLGKGDIFIRDAAVDKLNNPTSTKQNVTSTTGLVVLASQNANHRYWHNVDPLGGSGPPPPVAPTADFTGTPTSGPAPLVVTFSDASAGAPTGWSWAFGDGATSTAQNPSHTYAAAGTYTVSLTASNAAGSNTKTRTAYVTVTDPPPPGSTLTFVPVADAHVKSSSPTTNYGTDPQLRVRDGSPVYNPYLQFNTTGISGSIESVKLRLYVDTGTSDGGAVYGVGNGWTEPGITWNNAPAIGGSPLAAIGPTTTGTWKEVTIPAGAVTPNALNSFAIHNATSTSGYYSSRQGANPPQLVVTLSSGGGPPPPVIPTADFTGTPTSGPANLAVSFTDTSIGSPTSWSWTFGDGATSTAQHPSYTYTTPGTYTVSLTASNSAGGTTKTRTGYITVTTAPPPGSVLTFTPTADAHVKSTSANTNYGTLDYLQVRDGSGDGTATYNSYLMFDVAGVSGTVSSVTLRLFVTDASNDGGGVYAVASGWTETGIKWSNAPALPPSPLAQLGVVTAGTWVEIPLGAGAVSGNATYSFAIHNTITNSAMYSSREGANRPQLVVTLSN